MKRIGSGSAHAGHGPVGERQGYALHELGGGRGRRRLDHGHGQVDDIVARWGTVLKECLSTELDDTLGFLDTQPSILYPLPHTARMDILFL